MHKLLLLETTITKFTMYYYYYYYYCYIDNVVEVVSKMCFKGVYCFFFFLNFLFDLITGLSELCWAELAALKKSSMLSTAQSH